MAKFQSAASQTVIKIPLASLYETTNVRKEYDPDELKSLADSILKNGLLNPLTVKKGVENESGEKTYEIICGHRRFRALKELAKSGNDVPPVECIIRAGDMWTMQMIENIQRADLSSKDKEDAVIEMLNKGLTQTEIASMISKPLAYISDILAGAKVRQTAENAGIDTSSLKTRALAQLRSIDSKELPEKVRELSSSGGTNKAATEILRAYKTEKYSGTREDLFREEQKAKDINHHQDDEKDAPKAVSDEISPENTQKEAENAQRQTESAPKSECRRKLEHLWSEFCARKGEWAEAMSAKSFYEFLLEYIE